MKSQTSDLKNWWMPNDCLEYGAAFYEKQATGSKLPTAASRLITEYQNMGFAPFNYRRNTLESLDSHQLKLFKTNRASWGLIPNS